MTARSLLKQDSLTDFGFWLGPAYLGSMQWKWAASQVCPLRYE